MRANCYPLGTAIQFQGAMSAHAKNPRLLRQPIGNLIVLRSPYYVEVDQLNVTTAQ